MNEQRSPSTKPSCLWIKDRYPVPALKDIKQDTSDVVSGKLLYAIKDRDPQCEDNPLRNILLFQSSFQEKKIINYSFFE